jgi:hypothetical protein
MESAIKETRDACFRPTSESMGSHACLNVSQHRLPTRRTKISKMPRSRSPLVEAIRRRQPLHVIQQIVWDDPESVRRPVDDDGDNWYPLHKAVVAGASVDVIRFLADAHPPALREKDERGWLPLHLAVQPRPRRRRRMRSGQQDRHGGPDEQSLNVIRCLCLRWPEATRRLTNGGWDPFQIASHLGNWEAVRVLGEPPDVWRRHDGIGVPLHLAFAAHGASLAVIRYLLREPPQVLRRSPRSEPEYNGRLDGWRRSGRSWGNPAAAAPSPPSEESNGLLSRRAQPPRRHLPSRTPTGKSPPFRRSLPRTAAPRGNNGSSNSNNNSHKKSGSTSPHSCNGGNLEEVGNARAAQLDERCGCNSLEFGLGRQYTVAKVKLGNVNNSNHRIACFKLMGPYQDKQNGIETAIGLNCYWD